jgi:hypothetical protein
MGTKSVIFSSLPEPVHHTIVKIGVLFTRLNYSGQLSGEPLIRREIPMPRQVGDRYVCEKCGAQLVYEKACPCPETNTHAEICCGEQMKLISSQAPANQG